MTENIGRILRRVVDIRTGGDVKRCHGIRYDGSYTVAQHTWGALVLLLVLFPEYYDRLSRYLLCHDVPEAWIGDVPAPTKRFSRAVKTACDEMEEKIFRRLEMPYDGDLSAEDQRVLKACDHLELYLWAQEQIYGGNRHATCVARELESYFDESSLLEPAQSLYQTTRDFGQDGAIEHSTDALIRELNND